MRHWVRGALVLLACALAASCGQITGLSDDYTFDLDASGGNDATSDAVADAASDATGCNAAQTSADLLTLSQNKFTAAECRNCLATKCCTQIRTCLQNASCRESASCILQCQNLSGGGEKTSCIRSCSDGFISAISSCGSSCNSGAAACKLQ